MRYQTLFVVLLIGMPGLLLAESVAVDKLLEKYKSQGVTLADTKKGEALWKKTFVSKGEFPERSCTTCHTDELTKTGKHIKTGKEIKPMSPVINSERLTNKKMINKWFKRNCKWTMGRECTAQEKANILVYIENRTRF
ncbi:MAG: hypothetical protein DIZ80_10520 [endosymbiont of Galathealinum brachiosum]|uniref:Cytochrome c domain-containing protein n=1 Tax=endosymbiont of Galathealinum brachiosum TaxID=2200906 RepID=A0A370DCT9_9GAMM|nr:MAG: hypothetical protein DIZ80_10520 [endosymbiont of Galathealinum brachiosum]